MMFACVMCSLSDEMCSSVYDVSLCVMCANMCNLCVMCACV